MIKGLEQAMGQRLINIETHLQNQAQKWESVETKLQEQIVEWMTWSSSCLN